MCQCNRKKNYFRYYICSKKCENEFLRIELNIETENIFIEGEQQKIIRYVISNSGSKDIYGNILIYSNVFDRIVERNVFLSLTQPIVIERIALANENIEARAYFRVNDIWVYSKLVKVEIIPEEPEELNECYVMPMIKRSLASPDFRTTLRFVNNGPSDAINLRVIVNFDESMQTIQVLENNLPFIDYVRDGQKIIFSYPVFNVGELRIYQLVFTSQFAPAKTFMEAVVRTDNPNGYKSLNPIINAVNTEN